MLRFFKEVINNHFAIKMLTEVNIKTTIASTRLGWLWWFIDPLIMMAIYYFIIKLVFERGGENYHLFVLTGIVFWQFFARAVNISTTSISKNSMLIKQTGISLTTIIVIPSLVQMFFSLFGVLVILIWSYPQIGFHSLGILLLILVTGLLAFGIGLISSILNVFFKDTSKLIAYVLRAGFFLSPVLYPVSRILNSDSVPELIKKIYNLNPMAWIINASRSILLEGVIFSWQSFFVAIFLSLIIVQLGLTLMRYYSNQIVKML